MLRPTFTQCLMLLLTVGVGLALLAACGSGNGNTSQQGSESVLCGDLSALGTAINQVTSLSTASSLDDVSQALSNVASSASDVKSSIRDLKNNNDNQVQGAIANLEQALISAVNNGSIANGRDEISSAANQVASSVNNAKAEAQCPG